MYLIDFEYAGRMLSDFDSMVCSFDSSNSNEISLGSEITWNTVKNNHSNISSVISSSYGDSYTTPLSICKKMCGRNIDPIYSDIEIRQITKWLKRNKFYKFKPVYKDGEMQDVYYVGSFNIAAVTVGSNCIGFNLTFQSNAPYGFCESQIFDFLNLSANEKINIENDSDDYDYIYPKETITIKQSGDLIFSNNSFSDTTIVKNCKAGEIIHFNGETKTIVSSIGELHTSLYSDFNYVFPKLFCEDNMTENILSSSLPCDLYIEFTPRRKIGVI